MEPEGKGLQEDRRTDRQEETEGKRKSNMDVCLFIDPHVRTDESLPFPQVGPHAVFGPQHD